MNSVFLFHYVQRKLIVYFDDLKAEPHVKFTLKLHTFGSRVCENIY